MAAPDVLFKGIPRGPTRGYTAKVIQAARPELVVIPCCGSMSLAVVATSAGILPQNVICGDVSLYSTALGMAITGQDWRLELQPACGHEGLAEVLASQVAGDPISKAAAVLFAVRYLQYQKVRPTEYHQGMQRELLFGHVAYLEQFRAKIQALAGDLQGVRFQARDMWETLPEYMGQEKAMLLVNPPRYDGGYERQFRGVDDVFSWDVPPYQMFKEADYGRLMAMLGTEPALSLMYYATPDEDPSPLWGEPWRSVFADRPGRKRGIAINWIVANRSVIPHEASRTPLTDVHGPFQMFADGQVEADSQIWAQRLDRDVGEYYKHLWIHDLPGSYAENYCGLFVDGCLVSVIGLCLKSWRVGHTKKGGDKLKAPVSLTFAFSGLHETYRRLHKLCLLSILSTWFWEDFTRGTGYSWAGIPSVVQSTMLTKHPENKTARGTGFKLTDRQREGGQYKLTYYGSILERSREETVALWRKKYATLTR